ncbi:hypothetical protein OH77DRAFT_207284 [Trametes cingulata]|nr:hypothetical protein OH77DRAFT_207284 [Trametes cingulata]
MFYPQPQPRHRVRDCTMYRNAILFLLSPISAATSALLSLLGTSHRYTHLTLGGELGLMQSIHAV